MSRPRSHKAKKRTAKLIAHNVEFIDPMCCGSRVGYRVVYSKWNQLTMSVVISDCDRQVKMEFMEDSTTDPMLKIDNMLTMLHEAREAWLAGIKHFKKQNRGKTTKWQRPSNGEIRALAGRVLTNASA